jgi:hypothetical protein
MVFVCPDNIGTNEKELYLSVLCVWFILVSDINLPHLAEHRGYVTIFMKMCTNVVSQKFVQEIWLRHQAICRDTTLRHEVKPQGLIE